jgi:hypothetical protein
MTSDEARAALIEKAAEAAGSIRMVDTNVTEYAKAVLGAAIDVALDEAARMADGFIGCDQIAAAIRAMKKTD